LIERAARTCYKSECKITGDSAGEFVRKIAQVKKHVSVIEHASVTIRFVCDRGVSHEIVRHRIAAYSQESTRYCNYGKDQFGNEITVIQPPFWLAGSEPYMQWKLACESAEAHYFALLKHGASPQEARSVLPNSLKTEIVMTANLREWRHVFSLRCAQAAHPQMRQLMIPVLDEFQKHLPELFDDLKP
jgi:thymidylate synthase (FAD)